MPLIGYDRIPTPLARPARLDTRDRTTGSPAQRDSTSRHLSPPSGSPYQAQEGGQVLTDFHLTSPIMNWRAQQQNSGYFDAVSLSF